MVRRKLYHQKTMAGELSRYHAHFVYQLSEGLLGPLIVHSKKEPYRKHYDDEIILTLSDWYHKSGQETADYFISPSSLGLSPIPSAILVNGHGTYPCDKTNLPCDPGKQGQQVIKVQSGKRYRVRVINACTFFIPTFSIPGHQLITIETDGVDTVPVAFERIDIQPGQRYSFIVHMNSQLPEKYILIETGPLPEIPPNQQDTANNLIPTVRVPLEYTQHKVTVEDKIKDFLEGKITYPEQQKNPGPSRPYTDDPFLMDRLLQPYDKMMAPARFDQEIILNISRMNDAGGVQRQTINNQTYIISEEPVLSLIINNTPIPRSSNPLVIGHNKVIQVVLNNQDTHPHPFHLHGHTFWLLGGGTDEGDYDPMRNQLVLNGSRRDTMGLNPESWTVIRFVSDNPGAWLFHCHINWHLEIGLAAVFVEATEEIKKRFKIPKATEQICEFYHNEKAN